MKIGLISDTHSYLDPKVFDYFKDCDEIWHAGDIGDVRLLEQLKDFKKTRAVYGNIDGQAIRTECPEDNWFDCEGIKVWMTHIGGYPPKYNRRVKAILQNEEPDLFICGHSHILKVMKDPNNGLLHINPGAAGKQGFHRMKTIIRFEVVEKKVVNMEVIELGKRAAISN